MENIPMFDLSLSLCGHESRDVLHALYVGTSAQTTAVDAAVTWTRVAVFNLVEELRVRELNYPSAQILGFNPVEKLVVVFNKLVGITALGVLNNLLDTVHEILETVVRDRMYPTFNHKVAFELLYYTSPNFGPNAWEETELSSRLKFSLVPVAANEMLSTSLYWTHDNIPINL
jgi:hypothetical protein